MYSVGEGEGEEGEGAGKCKSGGTERRGGVGENLRRILDSEGDLLFDVVLHGEQASKYNNDIRHGYRLIGWHGGHLIFAPEWSECHRRSLRVQ